MIDTHAHLDACGEPASEIVRRAVETGVTRILTVGSDVESCRVAIELAEREEAVFAILGIHPHRAGEPEDGRLDRLRELLGHERAVAVGETGLDFFRDYAPREAQLRLFASSLELAGEVGKAVVVHTRDAEEETGRQLRAFEGTVVLHCFSSPALLPLALDRGFYVSFAGNVTYPRAEELRAVAARVPADRILAETDSPYLAPQPVRGQPNEPANVLHTLKTLAEVRGEDQDELQSQIEANARVAFALP